jgi:hypothetical protein
LTPAFLSSLLVVGVLEHGPRIVEALEADQPIVGVQDLFVQFFRGDLSDCFAIGSGLVGCRNSVVMLRWNRIR